MKIQKMTDNEQAYAINKIDKHIKNTKLSYDKEGIKYWCLNSEKIIRKFEMIGKTFVQIINICDYGKVYFAYCETENCITYFRTELTIEQLDNLLA